MAIEEAKKKKTFRKTKGLYIMQNCYQLMFSTPLKSISDENMIQKQWQHKTMNNVQKRTTKNDITTLVLEHQTLRFCCTFRYLTDTFRVSK